MKSAFRFWRSISKGILAALALPVFAQDEQETPTIEGTWRWYFAMPDGTTTRPKLVLVMRDGKLTGTTSFRPGSEVAITNAVLEQDNLRFQVVRHRDGQEVVTTYLGKWNGKTIQGRIESNWAGEKQQFEWLAERPHEGAEGTWKWTALFGGRKVEVSVELEQDGEKLTGFLPGRDGRKTAIKNGSYKNNEVRFDIERGTEENKINIHYTGKQKGDTITGLIKTTINGEERKANWDARRAD